MKSYNFGQNYIDIEFADHEVYRYDYASTGAGAVEEMKRLAERGQGLNTFISQKVRTHFAAKLRTKH